MGSQLSERERELAYLINGSFNNKKFTISDIIYSSTIGNDKGLYEFSLKGFNNLVFYCTEDVTQGDEIIFTPQNVWYHDSENRNLYFYLNGARKRKEYDQKQDTNFLEFETIDFNGYESLLEGILNDFEIEEE